MGSYFPPIGLLFGVTVAAAVAVTPVFLVVRGGFSSATPYALFTSPFGLFFGVKVAVAVTPVFLVFRRGFSSATQGRGTSSELFDARTSILAKKGALAAPLSVNAFTSCLGTASGQSGTGHSSTPASCARRNRYATRAGCSFARACCGNSRSL